MRLFPEAIEVADHEGFESDKDIFRRSNAAKGLTRLLEKADDPLVLAVDGQWGSGKTIFLKMWAGELRNKGFPVIYFDAFQNDYLDDGFVAIASEIVALAEEQKADDERTQRFVKRAISVGKILARSGLKLTAKVATAGALSSADLEEVSSYFTDEAGSVVDKYIGTLLTQQQERKETIESFRAALAELPGLLSKPIAADSGEAESGSDESEGGTEEDNAEQPVHPLIFIIDELDRCKPDFALEVLEKIKHLFSVPNVHFVFGAHMRQLRNSVVAAYGQGIDANDYLHKFVSLTFRLPHRSHRPDEDTAERFVAYLAAKMEIADAVTYLVREVAKFRNLSFRQIERIFTVLAVAIAYGGRNYSEELIEGLAILKVVEPDLYEKAEQGTLTYSEAKQALRLDMFSEESWARDHYVNWWRFATDKDLPSEDASKLSQEFAHYRSLERFEIVPTITREVFSTLRVG